MLRRTIVALAAIVVFTSITIAAPPKTGCKKFNFIGTFLSPSQQDVLGDGNIHKYAFQLTLSSDGNVNQYWTGLPDYMINAGTGSPQVGSWTCREDGMLVFVWLQAEYLPIVPPDNDPDLTSQDIRLTRTFKTTYLFSVDDDNTLRRVQSRRRVYQAGQDPTDPAGGGLDPINHTVVTYRRLIASDADIFAP